MRIVLIAMVVVGVSSAWAAPPTRKEFAALIAKVKPGMTGDQVKQLLGAPDDIKTERDPGGITAARTALVWRYGARKHLAFGTLGTVHIQADGKVQYVFGGTGTPYTGMPEPELRKLLELVDDVPSYNEVLDPLKLIRAVNALQPLGKDRALAVVDEYLRVSSGLDDSGREGVFLLTRTLFDVPPNGMPAMHVGAPAPAPPADPKLLPRFPLVLVDDVPIKIVGGYLLGGAPEQPETDVAEFRKVGTLRAKPLAPTAKALDAIHTFIEGPLAKAITVDDHVRIALYDQALRFFGTVYRPANLTVDSWFPWDKNVATRWQAIRTAVNKLGAKWNAKDQQLVLANGTTLTPVANNFQRVWWDLNLAGTTKSRVTLERISDMLVTIEIRLELGRGKSVSADAIRFTDPVTNKELGKLDFASISAPATSTSGSVMTSRLELPRGRSVRLELVSGARGPTLVP